MATKKNAAKKSAAKKSTPQKTSLQKDDVKKSKSKKFISKKVISKTTNGEGPNKEATVESAPKKSFSLDEPGDIPDNVNCICMQKQPDGNFYNFTLQQGRWVQSSAVPFPTREACEDACC
jgi:hypothetical protein